MLAVSLSTVVKLTCVTVHLGSALVNRLPQADFVSVKFGPGRLNLHVAKGGDSHSVVVFVHGLSGKGYKTWGQIPPRLFSGSEGEAVDVAVYDYVSGIRRLRSRGASFDFWVKQLAAHLHKLEGSYHNIFLVGHSLGGLIVEAAAMKFVQASRKSYAEAASPLAALVLVAAPRAGSGWALPALARLLPDFSVLGRLTNRNADVDEFFATNVERLNTVSSATGRFVLPTYAALAGADRYVSTFSAAFGVPTGQRLHLTGSHSSIVKPADHDSEIVCWLHGLITERRQVAEQAARERLHAASRPPPLAIAARPTIVTKFWSDPSGLLWEQLYNEARRTASTHTVTVHDVRDVPDADVDLLIAVHDADLVLALSAGVRESVHRARVECDLHRSLTVGISPVGPAYQPAELTLLDWLAHMPHCHSVYVAGAEDADQLRDLMARWLQVVISRDPRRAAADTRWDNDLSVQTSAPEYHTNGGYL